MGEARRTHGSDEKYTKSLAGKFEMKAEFGRNRRRWKNSMRMDITEVWWVKCGLDSSGSGQGSVAGSSEHRDLKWFETAVEQIALCSTELPVIV
jgi:hypothetical protein